MADHPPFKTAAELASPALAHGFFGREGGVSAGIFASLNCGLGSSDAAANTAENRKRAAAALGAAHLLTLYQHHSADVLEVTEPWVGQGPRADAMVTTKPGIALGILAADCAPVLFADETAGVIGAAHAGWKGAFTGVLETTVNAMENLGAKHGRIRAVVGPCIGPQSYEVGPEFEERFRLTSKGYSVFFMPSPKPKHFLFDLPAFVRSRLEADGIQEIVTVGACTYLEESRYFSYRRATHRGEADYGRNLSAILLRG